MRKKAFLLIASMLMGCNAFAQISHLAQKPIDRSLARHNFLYAGEGKQRRIYIVKDGQVTWKYNNPQGRGEISDAVLMTDGNVLVAHQYGICEVTQQGQTLWSYAAPEGTEIHTIQPIGRKHVLFVQNGHTIINDWLNEWRTPIDTLNAPVQAIEINKKGKVVWQLCAWRNPDLGPSTTIQPLNQAVNRDRLFFGHFNAAHSSGSHRRK